MPRGARARSRRLTASVSVVAIVCAGMLAVGAAGSVRPAFATTAASAFLPPDGHAEIVTIGERMQQREHWVMRGAQPLLGLPGGAATYIFGTLSDNEIAGRHWLMLHTDITAAEPVTSAQRATDVYTDAEDGIRLLASIDASNGFVFVPGVVVLGAEAAPGHSWASEGVVALALVDEAGIAQQGWLDYRAEYRARTPSHTDLLPLTAAACLEVEGSLAFVGSAQPEPVLLIEEVTLWCPGQGIVASVTSDDGGLTWVRGAVTAVSDPPEPVRAAHPPTVDPASWAARSGAAQLLHRSWGPTPRALTPALAPVVIGDTLVVALTGNAGMSFVREIDGTFEEVRLAAPGGQVTALGRVGEQVIALTSQRRVLAYRADGVRLWSAELDDLVVAPPLEGPGGEVVVATLGGVVSALSPSDGSVRWRVEATGDAIDHLVRSADTLVVGDRAGGITALGAAGSRLWSHGGAVPEVVVATAHAVYVARDFGIERIDPDTGETLWSHYLTEGVNELAVLGDVVVALTWNAVLGVDAATGEQRWQSERTERLSAIRGAVGSDSVLVDGLPGAGGTGLLGADGTPLVVWPQLGGSGLLAARFLAADAGGAWIVDSVAGVVRIGP